MTLLLPFASASSRGRLHGQLAMPYKALTISEVRMRTWKHQELRPCRAAARNSNVSATSKLCPSRKRKPLLRTNVEAWDEQVTVQSHTTSLCYIFSACIWAWHRLFFSILPSQLKITSTDVFVWIKINYNGEFIMAVAALINIPEKVEGVVISLS